MKKIVLRTLFIGGITLGLSIFGNTAVLAADSLTGKTDIAAKTIAGDVTLMIDGTVDFKEQPLSPEINFGSQDLNYTVTDYSGSTNGYILQAQLEDQDMNRTLQVDGKEISTTGTEKDDQGNEIPTTPTSVVDKATDVFGDNTDKLPVTLKYKNVTEIKDLTTKIEWTLIKGGTVTP